MITHRSLLLVIIGILCFLASGALASGQDEEGQRTGKVLPVFNVVKFKNEICTGTNKNGTCYTEAECSSLSGTADGDCAEGFGVCCTFTLSCGDSSSQNLTFIEQTSVTSLSSCNYEICTCSADICRIKFDFTTLVMANPSQGTVEATTTAAVRTASFSAGQCVTDSLSISGNSGKTAPVICGTNSGQHMIIDVTGSECVSLETLIGTADTSTSRQWKIEVTQYLCTDEIYSGSEGCLQYYTATTGTIQSYAMPSSGTIDASQTHLVNQDYSICFKRTNAMTCLCLVPDVTASTSVSNQASFGFSISPDTTASQAGANTVCSTDYIDLPGGVFSSAGTLTAGTTTAAVTRVCGRFFGTQASTANDMSLCTRSQPFTVGVHTDGSEVCTGASNDPQACELTVHPGGIIGFRLDYEIKAC